MPHEAQHPVATVERAGATAFDYDLHDGAMPTRIQWYFLDQSRLPVAVQVWELPPGGSEGEHTHPAEEPLEELYLVVAGTARMHLDGEAVDLSPGDAVLAPVGSAHDLHNTGTSSLRVVVIWGRPGEADWSGFGTARAARAARQAADLFAGPADTEWEADRERVDQSLRDPWQEA